jgi:hypothetical protein
LASGKTEFRTVLLKLFTVRSSASADLKEKNNASGAFAYISCLIRGQRILKV